MGAIGEGAAREEEASSPHVKGRRTEKHTLGLYSAFLACSAIVFRSSRHSRLTVATIFLHTRQPRGKMREVLR